MIPATSDPPRSRTGAPAAMLRLLRPKQWTKNLFVLPAPLFGLAHSGVTGDVVLRTLGAFAAFCMLSSTVYVLNDIVDAPADRLHPKTRLRPIASGAVAIGGGFEWVALAYIGNSLAYIALLKRRVIADVLSIAFGFMLRIVGGTQAAGVAPSSWLMICGFSIALFLGFCKRRSEIDCHSDSDAATAARAVLSIYTAEKLNVLASATASISIVTYMLFTVSPETKSLHGTSSLIYTSPFVVYCVFRFLLKTLEQRGEDAAETLFGDAGFIAAAAGWATSVAWILYSA